MTDRGVQFVGEASAGLESLVAELYLKSGCQEFGLSREQFAAILESVRAKYLAVDAQPVAVQELLYQLAD